MKYQLKTRQVCLLIIALFPVVKIFVMPSVLAGHANEDLWISVLFNLALDFITLTFILRACKRTNKNFFGILEENFGAVGAKVIACVYLVTLMLKAIVPLNEQKDYVELTLYTLMPSKLYFLPAFAVIFYLCTKRLRVLGRAADVLWFFTLVGMGLLFALSIPNADFGAILPIGANGISNISRGSYDTVLWHGDIIYLMFFIGEFEFKKKDGLKILLSFLISALLITAFMIIFYSVFTSIAFRQRFALTEISKYTAVINNIGRFDYLGIIFILFSNLFALALPLYFSCRILNYVCGFSRKWIAPIIVVALHLGVMVLLTQYYAGIERFITDYAGWLFLIVGNVFPVVIAFTTKKEKRYEINA